jgi:glycerol transport system ATP-binding protein
MTIQLESISLRRDGVDYLADIDLRIEPGGFNVLLGPTLSGKTTLLRMMAGLEHPDGGRVLENGKDVTGVAVQKRNVAMVYQQFINYPSMTVFDNIASPLKVAGLPRSEIRKRVGEVSGLLKLGPMLERRPSELSGGQQQRAALARALVKRAHLVLLDEPLANLDYKLREELRDELPKLFADRDCTVVYATTEPTEALLLGGHTACLHQGRVTQFGETIDIYRRPADLRSARVFSDPPINSATVKKEKGRFILTDEVSWEAGERYAGLPDGHYTLAVRPHHVTPRQNGERAVPIEGRVLVGELSGSESIIHFEVDEGTWVSLSHGIHPFKVGEVTRLYIEVDHCLYFDQEDRRIA